jgi:hypothetical protein
MLTRRRMPSVSEHLQVVLQAQNDITDDDIVADLERLRGDGSAPEMTRDPLEYDLNISDNLEVCLQTSAAPKSSR